MQIQIQRKKIHLKLFAFYSTRFNQSGLVWFLYFELELIILINSNRLIKKILRKKNISIMVKLIIDTK